jgi:hypothetical protein
MPKISYSGDRTTFDETMTSLPTIKSVKPASESACDRYTKLLNWVGTHPFPHEELSKYYNTSLLTYRKLCKDEIKSF